MQPQINEALKHFGKGLSILADAFTQAGLGSDPTAQTQDPVTTARATTSKAKKEADKKAKEEIEADATEREPVETKTEKKATGKKAKEVETTDAGEFEALDREEKINALRQQMVQVSVKVNGDKDKVYAFLKKYKAMKVNELSDENLLNLKTDVDNFLSGPEELDI